MGGKGLLEVALFTFGATERRELSQLTLNFKGSSNQRKWDLRGDYDNLTGKGIGRLGYLSFRDIEYDNK